jgi:hypothetical protein
MDDNMNLCSELRTYIITYVTLISNVLTKKFLNSRCLLFDDGSAAEVSLFL